MTAQVHDHPMDATTERADESAPHARGTPGAARPWWLLPGLAAALLAAGLVAAGVLALSTVIYIGLFAGMFLMHAGGHGGHGGHAGGGHDAHAGHRGSANGASQGLSQGSHRSHPAGPASDVEREGRVPDATRGETQDHDQHSSHGCH